MPNWREAFPNSPPDDPMPTFSARRQWADSYLLQMRKLIAPHAFCQPSPEQDLTQATDLIVLNGWAGRPLTIACRMRRWWYYEHGYGNQFTLRLSLPTLVETEYQKIRQGWGDWMFYGFGMDQGPAGRIPAWSLLDLNVFRSRMTRDASIPYSDYTSRDGNVFRCFDLESFGPDLLIAWARPKQGTGVST